MGRTGNVCDTEVACKDEKEWDEVYPRTGSAVRAQDLEKHESGVHHMLGDIGPSWESRLESAMTLVEDYQQDTLE